jgi:hypothetical protein
MVQHKDKALSGDFAIVPIKDYFKIKHYSGRASKRRVIISSRLFSGQVKINPGSQGEISIFL